MSDINFTFVPLLFAARRPIVQVYCPASTALPSFPRPLCRAARAPAFHRLFMYRRRERGIDSQAVSNGWNAGTKIKEHHEDAACTVPDSRDLIEGSWYQEWFVELPMTGTTSRSAHKVRQDVRLFIVNTEFIR